MPASPIEVASFRTPTLPPATATNSYVLGKKHALLIEPATPYEDEQSRFVQWVKRLQRDGHRVEACVLTHHHHDHAAGAARICGELALPLWAHEETAKRLTELSFARLLHDGEELQLGDRGIEFRLTPGHARGHICVADQGTGAIIAGDMVAGEGTILIDPDDGGEMRAYLESLERLRGATRLLPAHGEAIDAVEESLDALIAHRMGREAKVVAGLDRPRRLRELLEVVYADTPRALWPLAEKSLRAHVDKLVQDERAVLGEDGRYALSKGRWSEGPT